MVLSIIIPVFNERETIAAIINKVLQVPIAKEILVVDDCSTDGTREILEKIANAKDVSVLYHSKNRGKGSAIRTALEKVTGDIVIVQDADLEYDPMDFVPILRVFKEKNAKVVYGSRRLNPDNKQFSGITFYIGGVVLSLITNLLYGIRITDEPTCYKALDANLLKELDLKCERFEFCPEVTAKVAKRKIPIFEVPISYNPRHKSNGKKINWRDGVEAIWTWQSIDFFDKAGPLSCHGLKR